MTIALCLNCGNIKFGVLCKCEYCGNTHGDLDLSLQFSGHLMDLEHLEEYASILRTIRSSNLDEKSQIDAFLLYVSNNEPALFEINLSPKYLQKLNEFLCKVV